MLLRERNRNRLKDFDYSTAGYYFVTICTKYMQEWFGDVVEGKMMLNECGRIVQECWFNLPNHYSNCRLDEFIVMPNHVHGIINLHSNVGNGLKPFPTIQYSLSEVIRGLKTFSSRKINKIDKMDRFQWQKSFYDHIIRTEQSLYVIRKYIRNNPLKWDEDRNNPKNLIRSSFR